ncbi:MAG: hypothetical protein IJR19_00210 [Lachnospiraceae bacterium]|nr:hypothetical protein [Lachnospiraceae bacterium]
MKAAWFCIPAHGHTDPTPGPVRQFYITIVSSMMSNCPEEREYVFNKAV